MKIRKLHRQQALDVLQTIEEAQENNAFQIAQDGIEALLDFVDSLYNEDTELANLLAKHYELLYKASIGEVKIKVLRKHFLSIKNIILNDFKQNHIEIAFLPHISSAASALESIYHAANEDPDCDAYWIPVPYYHGAEPEKMILEGQEHYPNIPCVSLEDYNIEERRPDAIFTFYTYERNNLVNLSDNLLLQNLKHLTDMLVWVPYYVDVDEYAYTNTSINHPCYLHVHKAILGTETQRDIIINGYTEKNKTFFEIKQNLAIATEIQQKLVINEFAKMYENTSQDSSIEEFFKEYETIFMDPNEKFVAMGSPMYDKVLTTTKEDCKLPKEWANIIKNKQVIIFISSVGMLSRCTNRNYLEYTVSTLSTFQKRDDVILWWRPHPAMEMALKSNPTSLAAYKRIVRTYKSGGWGIYDDTGDLHRAIAWGDGLYGDTSSVMVLYQVTGKPIMMANTCGELYEKMKRCYTKLGGVRFEDEQDTLEQFIDDIVTGKFAGSSPTMIPNAGKNIYSYIKSLVIPIRILKNTN